MNGKTAKKLLMRGRAHGFWGRRAYLTVRLPLSIVSPPPPAPVFPGLAPSPYLDGLWLSPDESEHVSIEQLFCGADPSAFQHKPWEPVYFAERERPDPAHGGWSFWTGHRGRKVGDGVEHEPLPMDIVAMHRARDAWQRALYRYGQNDVLDAFLATGEWAKSMDWAVDGEHLLVMYGVKWFYPERKRRFAALLSRAMKTAKRAGVAARVLRAV
jgi:hypothetical protein